MTRDKLVVAQTFGRHLRRCLANYCVSLCAHYGVHCGCNSAGQSPRIRIFSISEGGLRVTARLIAVVAAVKYHANLNKHSLSHDRRRVKVAFPLCLFPSFVPKPKLKRKLSARL